MDFRIPDWGARTKPRMAAGRFSLPAPYGSVYICIALFTLFTLKFSIEPHTPSKFNRFTPIGAEIAGVVGGVGGGAFAHFHCVTVLGTLLHCECLCRTLFISLRSCQNNLQPCMSICLINMNLTIHFTLCNRPEA